MKHLLEVCLLGLTLTTMNTAASAQELQRGISVQLAVTGEATPMPGADRANALIATIADDGRVYLGIDPANPAELVAKIKAGRSQGGRGFYVKADARTAYADVVRVLQAGREAAVASPILLTAPSREAPPGTVAPPQGWDVLVGSSSSAPGSTVLRLTESTQREPILKVNGQLVSWSSLQSVLPQLLRDRNGRMVLLTADGTTRFEDVARVVDLCRSTGSQVTLSVPSL
jgi:biopolymer transport protein ExbD